MFPNKIVVWLWTDFHHAWGCTEISNGVNKRSIFWKFVSLILKQIKINIMPIPRFEKYTSKSFASSFAVFVNQPPVCCEVSRRLKYLFAKSLADKKRFYITTKSMSWSLRDTFKKIKQSKLNFIIM